MGYVRLLTTHDCINKQPIADLILFVSEVLVKHHRVLLKQTVVKQSMYTAIKVKLANTSFFSYMYMYVSKTRVITKFEQLDGCQ